VPIRNVEVEFESSTAIVILRGEHDLNSETELGRALASASGCRDVLVDLSECTFLASSIVSVLLLASGRLHRHGGLLELVTPGGAGSHPILRVLDLMGLDRLLPLHETRAAAIEYLKIARPETLAKGARLRPLRAFDRRLGDRYR
jgi:anti-anti-sigma factor